MTACAALTRYGFDGKPIEPRPCARSAKVGPFCGLHTKLGLRPVVQSTSGGWCIWCTLPGRAYGCSRDPGRTIVFCDGCARALGLAFRTVVR